VSVPRVFRSPRTSVPDAEHLTHLLDEAQRAIDLDRPRLAITHLYQAVHVARTKDSELSEFELLRRMKHGIKTGGEFDA
jgi:hypothetical protein